MGKGHSKHGQCYLVNAHFNPLCQLEDSNSIQSVGTPLTSKDSGLQLTPEISFTLSEENKTNSDKEITTKCALEVFLPEETVTTAVKNSVMDLKIKNPSEEIQSKEQEITLECIKNNNSEKQEFSFVLHNYAGQEQGKDDVEKIVMHSICEALKTSLKLPPSGTHTLKVHLVVSPDREKNPATVNQSDEKDSTSEKRHCVEPKPSNMRNISCQDLPFNFTSPDVSDPVKSSNLFTKCCQEGYVNLVHHNAENEKKCDAFSSPRCKRNRLLSQRKESRRRVDSIESEMKDNKMLNVKCSPRNSFTRERRHRPNVENHNIGDCSHYLDLAELKISDSKEYNIDRTNKCDLRYLNPAYCSPRHSERGNVFCRPHKQNYEFQDSHMKKSDVQHRLYDTDLHSGILRYKLLNRAKNNHLDLSFDLGDIEDKQPENDLHSQHRRSRSYDTNQYSFVNSPKLKHRNCSCAKCGILHQNNVVPPSPSRHHRHRHKEREKDKLRAMQQVARWLEREDLSHAKPHHQQKDSWVDSESCSQKDTVIERHEYHHIHEHHHYYHYVES